MVFHSQFCPYGGLQSSTVANNLIYGYQGYGICLYTIDSSGPSSNNVIANKRQGKRVLYTLDPGVAKATGGKLRLQAPPYNVAVEGL